MKINQAIKFWKALDTTTNMQEIVSSFANKHGYDGKQRNKPSVRFGNLSMMPEFIHHPSREIKQESFIVETRSLSGYSGSPVFVYTAPFYPRPGQKGRSSRLMLYLLGIDWCHINDYKRILESDKETPIEEKWYVESNMGMAGVVPAWKINELLDTEELVTNREEKNKELEKEPRPRVTLDSNVQQGVTEEQFKDDLKKVSRKIKK